MIVYCIETPYVSNGLRKTYKKELEVFSGELDDQSSYNPRVVVDTVHYWSKDKWKQKSYDFLKYITVRTENIKDIPSTEYTEFTSLDVAKISKLLAIKNLEKGYLKELENLQELFKRNVPDVSKQLKELQDIYPEYFL